MFAYANWNTGESKRFGSRVPIITILLPFSFSLCEIVREFENNDRNKKIDKIRRISSRNLYFFDRL